MRRLALAIAAATIASATPVAAQTVDWGSAVNRTWWNGITEAELRELVTEAGGTWRDLDDTDDFRSSEINWPDLPGVLVREGECPSPEQPMKERNCGLMLLAVSAVFPDNLEEWWLDNGGWLAFGAIDEGPALYRLERHQYGTTRGHVLATIMQFRAHAVRETRALEDLSLGLR